MTLVEKPRASDLDAANPPPWLEACSEFLVAWREIEAHGLLGWMALHGVEPHPALPEAMQVFEGELERLRHEHMVERTEALRKKARGKKK